MQRVDPHHTPVLPYRYMAAAFCAAALALNCRKPKQEDPAAPLPGINQYLDLFYTWDWHSAFMHRYS